MKRTLLMLLALLLSVSLFACEKPIREYDPENFSPDPPSKTENIAADSIRYYVSPSFDYEVFILERDGKFGVIDERGNVLVEPTWDVATLAHTARNDSEWGTAEIKVHLSMENAFFEGAFVNADGTLTEGNWGGWGFGRSLVYWDVEAEEPLLFSSGDGYTEFRGTDVSGYRRPDRAGTYFRAAADTREKMIAVQAITDYEIVENESGNLLFVTTAKDGKYALLSLETGKLLTDFVYTDFDPTGEIGDAIAMKKDGGWGYVDTAGREITEFYYLPAYTFPGWKPGTGEIVAEGMFPAANGVLVVNEGERYGILEVGEGKVLVPARYQDISLVNPNGRYWAENDDGTWSCHHLSEG